MFIAQQKRKDNIAEYVLYMWQLEDLIRAYKLDIESIAENVINKMTYGEEGKAQIRDWYESLIEMMRLEGVQEKGHLQMVKNTVSDVTDLHYALLKSPKYPGYSALFYQTLSVIGAFRQRQDNPDAEDIELCFVFLYGVLMLRLQKREISQDTQIALTQISKLLALLSHNYKLYLNNELELDEPEV
ncbi:DUF4924 family protein [Paludibacter jiangxiensis]|uniref:DUF4924 domain-containing protein n=1 Tax=Paludibacter jiangxiensis TaxID=681398 RepID=A0A171A445_9BACT|nr:DUF4924 family protein [Paludibacter jiangxiensis]GAT63266.1 hypothetical protein PJIAN_3583 [Paludibacter jiangxiensis]